jgi:hypothetical protein
MSYKFFKSFTHLALAIIILGSGYLSSSLNVQAATSGSVTIQWAANTEPDLAGYRLYQGTSQGTYGSFIDLGNITSYQPVNLQTDQTYYFAVTAYDMYGNESLPSPEVNTSSLSSFGGTGSASTLTISNLKVANGKSYVIASGLQTENLVYIDRTYTATTVPSSVQGARYIQTANDDKSATELAFLSFDVDQPVNVYVAHDSRITIKPDWLSTFINTGQDLKFSGHTDPFRLYAKSFPAGTITLGGNTGGYSMYSVIIEPDEQLQDDGVQLLTVMSVGTGGGTVVSSPSGIDCGTTCSTEITSGTVALLSAHPNANSTFDGWSGDSDCDDGQVTMTGSVNCTAIFTVIDGGGSLTPTTSLLSVSITGNGSVISSPYGLECTKGTCSTSFETGALITLTAKGDRPYKFEGWSGVCSGKSECAIQLATDQFVGANFERNGNKK